MAEKKLSGYREKRSKWSSIMTIYKWKEIWKSIRKVGPPKERGLRW